VRSVHTLRNLYKPSMTVPADQPDKVVLSISNSAPNSSSRYTAGASHRRASNRLSNRAARVGVRRDARRIHR
jgi:hypothetical protein